MRVIMIGATTICGRISPAGFGSSLDRALLEKLRDETDAGLMGAGTLRAEDPEMRGSGRAFLPKRLRAIITRSGTIPSGKKLFTAGPTPLIFTTSARAETLRQELGAAARVIGLPPENNGFSIGAVLAALAGMGATSVLIEGGGGLNYSCLKEGVVHEIYLTIAPFISGDRHAATLAAGNGSLGHPFLPLELLSCESTASGEIFLHYRIKKEENRACNPQAPVLGNNGEKHHGQ